MGALMRQEQCCAFDAIGRGGGAPGGAGSFHAGVVRAHLYSSLEGLRDARCVAGSAGAGYTARMVQDERVNTHYKDTVFRLLFSDKARLLSLYNALSDKRCDNVDDLKVVTLADAIYMEVKNDIAFLVGTDIHLWEHQSTVNPNMPLRFLEYITSEYQRLTDKRSIYSRKLVKLPTPHFVVFYNGIESTPDHSVLKLSSAFEGSADVPEGEGEQPTLELLVDVYNINAGHNGAIQEACATLKGYADFVRRTRENPHSQANAYEFDVSHSETSNSHTFFILSPLSILPAQAVSASVDDCIHDGILADFLKTCKAEVIGMSIFEFDREEYERQVRAEERQEGEARGEYNKAVSTARNMIRMGFSTEQIAQATELSLEEVAAL